MKPELEALLKAYDAFKQTEMDKRRVRFSNRARPRRPIHEPSRIEPNKPGAEQKLNRLAAPVGIG